MTLLDQYEPRGERIHPFDLYLKMNESDTNELVEEESSPVTEDEADYLRNMDKVGHTVRLNGTLYFETSRATPSEKALAVLR